MNKGVHLWNEAKKIIPGGNQLLSKRSEMFLPEGWPSYYKKAKGVAVWDLDDRKLIDMSIMGIGTCVLGYADDAVNAAVKEAVDDGNMCTLNCYEEVELARKLIQLHPWAEMARFARTGGEACTIAVRIGRAAAKKNKVAFCGYHGWSDWYLSANLQSGENLNQQLLSGLKTLGVPEELKNTSFPFHYGKIEELEKIFSENKGEVGVVIMEVQRHHDADIEFLSNVRKLADRHQCVLIYDEVTSGFRLRAGGMHVLYGLEPDIVVLGKAMGNGYPISAILGKARVMQAAQETFISSSYWTERVGFVAALEVIKKFENENVHGHLNTLGLYTKKKLQNLFKEKHLDVDVVGLPPIPIMVINDQNSLKIKTLMTQEMLKKGYLASNLIFLSFAHNVAIVDEYIKAFGESLDVIVEGLKNNDLDRRLEGPVCHAGFQRLN